jgi:recombination protein RecA
MAKKKKRAASSDLSGFTLEKQIEQLNKMLKANYGDRAVCTGADLNTDGTVLSSGSIRVDIALRKPFPMGIHEIAGGMGAGKSTMAIHLCANAQKKGWPTYYIDLERGLSDEFLNRFKDLDKEKLIVLEPTTSEDATEMALDIFRTVDHAVVIYDSVPCSLATEAVMAKTMGEQTMGIVAKLMGTFLAKAVPLISDSKGRLILLNQLRDNLSMYGGRPTPGGNPVEHWPGSRLFIKGHNTKANLIKDKNGTPIGKKVTVQIVKNRKAPPGGETDMSIHFASGIWRNLELLNVATEFGIIDKSGSWYSYGDRQIGQGEIKAMDTLEEEPDLFQEVKDRIYGLLGFTDEV